MINTINMSQGVTLERSPFSLRVNCVSALCADIMLVSAIPGVSAQNWLSGLPCIVLSVSG